jgi:hypothetical protein
MSDKRYQFLVTGPGGSAAYETDNSEILRRVGEALRDPSVSRAMVPEEPRAGRPKKAVFVIASEDLFSLKPGTEFEDCFAAAKALKVAPLSIRQALYVARKNDKNFASVRGVTFSYSKDQIVPEFEGVGTKKKAIIVIALDDDSPLVSLRAFDQFESAVETAEVFGVRPATVTQALYYARLQGVKQAKVKGVTLAYLEDYAETVRG